MTISHILVLFIIIIALLDALRFLHHFFSFWRIFFSYSLGVGLLSGKLSIFLCLRIFLFFHHSWRKVLEDREFGVNSSWSTWKILCYFSLFSIVSVEKFTVAQIGVSLWIMPCFCLVAFKILSLLLVFRSWFMICVDMDFFEFIPLGVPLAF